MKSIGYKTAAAVIGASLCAAAQAVDFDVTVTNLTHGMYLGPILVAAHAQGAGVFSPGSAASTNMITLAENGDVSGLNTDFISAGADTTTLTGSVGGNKLGPGESVSQASFISGAGNDRLSILCKLMPTNDGFAAVTSIVIPTDPGRYVFNLVAYDAGSEANDELVTVNGATVDQPGIGFDANVPTDTGASGGASGADGNTTIHVHRGALGDDNPTGGTSDLDVTRHRWLNPVARVIVDVN